MANSPVFFEDQHELYKGAYAVEPPVFFRNDTDPFSFIDGVSITKGASTGRTKECSICQEEITDDQDTIHHFSCKNTFHAKCASGWAVPQFVADGCSSCPICRAPFAMKDRDPEEVATLIYHAEFAIGRKHNELIQVARAAYSNMIKILSELVHSDWREFQDKTANELREVMLGVHGTYMHILYELSARWLLASLHKLRDTELTLETVFEELEQGLSTAVQSVLAIASVQQTMTALQQHIDRIASQSPHDNTALEGVTTSVCDTLRAETLAIFEEAKETLF